MAFFYLRNSKKNLSRSNQIKNTFCANMDRFVFPTKIIAKLIINVGHHVWAIKKVSHSRLP